MYSFHCFKGLGIELQMEALSLCGIPLDLACVIGSTEAVLFAYNDFYVELVVEKITDEIISLHCFKSIGKLSPYLHQIDIGEISVLLTCSK